jgi:hypothetical protein
MASGLAVWCSTGCVIGAADLVEVLLTDTVCGDWLVNFMELEAPESFRLVVSDEPCKFLVLPLIELDDPIVCGLPVLAPVP